jgi:hypothetical protein
MVEMYLFNWNSRELRLVINLLLIYSLWVGAMRVLGVGPQNKKKKKKQVIYTIMVREMRGDQ